MLLSTGAFYLINPREKNGIRTFREKLSPTLATDLDYQRTTGVYRMGDAAFADYALNVGIQYTFQKAAPEFELPG